MEYQKQMERVKRWLARIEPKGPKRDYGAQNDYADFLRAFFIEAWHLCDWIKHDKNYTIGAGIRDKALEKPSLKICMSLTNQAKHSELDLKRRNSIDVRPAGTDVTVSGLGFPGELYSQYRYRKRLPDGTEFVSLDLARKIVADWEAVIRDYVEPNRKP